MTFSIIGFNLFIYKYIYILIFVYRKQTELRPLNDEWRNQDRYENALKIEEMKQHMYDTLLATL